ncbi:hypothetical protein D9615_001525 [Tricholomella constricta]|uniref:Uncharacterized protein n=1 Tax=Tricholomella constricta TaxID=117010 RepID=A0A8H5MAE5_9AGAR|nr:hypothetical protein D9615_001525 [Tricholomella constricta]
MHLPLWLFLSFFLSRFWRASALVTNRTIDDTTGDVVTGARPVYLPTTSFTWEDATCKRCAITPDPSQAFKGTWTAATYKPELVSMSIELSFRGTAIYVFFILANFIAEGIATETACNFTLDGRPAGSFHHIPSTSRELEYNVPAFSQANLANIDHKLIVSTSGITDREIFVNFDYAIYTFDDAPTTTISQKSTTTSQGSQTSAVILENPNDGSRSKVNIGAIVGGVIGGVAALLALILLLVYFRRRQRVSRAPPANFSIDGDDLGHPMAPPPVGWSNSDGSIVPFLTGAVATSAQIRARPETQSDFLQSGTIVSPSMVTLDSHSFYRTSSEQVLHHTGPSHTNSDLVDIGVTGTLNTSAPPDNNFSAHGVIASAKFSSGGIPFDTSAYGGIITASTAPLAHMRPGSTATPDARQDELRRGRQLEIDRQLRAVKRDMHNLRSDITTETARQPPVRQRRGDEGTEVAEMREQMRLMKQQIAYLQTQQQSDWALGLSNEPPPGYSAQHPSSLGESRLL